jgi:hypothetical protein
VRSVSKRHPLVATTLLRALIHGAAAGQGEA